MMVMLQYLQMYLQCVLISRDKTQADEQISKIMSELNKKQVSEVYETKEYQSSVRVNRKYLDTHLTQQSTKNNQRLKAEVQRYQVEYVIVSPLRADLQTCLDIFGISSHTTVSVQPALVPKISSVAHISEDNTHLLEAFKEKPLTVKLQENPNWFLSYGRNSSKLEGKSLQDCISQLQKDKHYESDEHFMERLREFKKNLINCIGKTKTKLAIIAHPTVLEALTSTGHHQDYKLINSIPFTFGEIKCEFIWIQGFEGELQSSFIPFCS